MEVDFAKNRVIQKRNDRIRKTATDKHKFPHFSSAKKESRVGAEHTACGTWRRRGMEGEGEEEEGGVCVAYPLRPLKPFHNTIASVNSLS